MAQKSECDGGHCEIIKCTDETVRHVVQNQIDDFTSSHLNLWTNGLKIGKTKWLFNIQIQKINRFCS